jgi:predicted nucleotidyltransferase
MTALTMSKTELRERARRLVLRQRRGAGRGSVEPAGRETLLSAVRRWAAEVHTRYPDVRVFLFGSLVSAERWRGAASDIDLAVAGVHGAAYWQIWKLAEEMLPGARIDLVDLEMATSSFREAVERSGVQL